MKKELPKIKKSLKSFIIEEDAKVIDKTATKIALSISLSLVFLDSIDDVNAKGHGSHLNHQNILDSGDFKQVRSGEETIEVTEVTHSNHYTRENDDSWGLW
ncbi:MAG: hypothetical protein HRU03_08295 [Nanoarchaeales archaeon]|nr:hypothetical protein [Nanoarchaeales archaeon]